MGWVSVLGFRALNPRSCVVDSITEYLVRNTEYGAHIGYEVQSTTIGHNIPYATLCTCTRRALSSPVTTDQIPRTIDHRPLLPIPRKA